MRAENRKKEERRKQELTMGARVLTTILDTVTAPMIKADLEFVTRDYLDRLPQEYRTTVVRGIYTCQQRARIKKPIENRRTPM